MWGNFLRYIIVAGLLFGEVVSFAQPTGGGPGGGADPDVPIDGFISLLIVAGSFLGIKKLRSKNK
ncbi:MAG: hypothetical protein OEY34_02935 [Cyclobacteriaceae bacterium]|nr:hypothetical protein [Cyclobacteriaceae bacterium]